MQQRVIEIQFYYIIERLYKHINDIDALQELIDVIALFGAFNITTIQHWAEELLCDIYYRPAQVESIVALYHHSKWSVRTICKMLHIAPNTIYEVIDKNEKDPIELVPRMKKVDAYNMQQFIIACEKVKEVFKWQ